MQRFAKRCIDWQVFHDVLDRPKKGQAAIELYDVCIVLL